MVARVSQCSDDRLARLIASDNPRVEDPEWLDHVDACVHCQKRLEQLAADREQWKFVADLASYPSLAPVPSVGQVDNTHQWEPSQLEGESLAKNVVQYSSTLADRPSVSKTTSQPPSNRRGGVSESNAYQTRDDQSVSAIELAFLDHPIHEGTIGRLSGYEILEVLGRGGMGIVLKAHDRALDRLIAIKVLAPHLACSGAARQRFLREARAAAAVVHENVVAIHGVDSIDGLPFIVMPYVPGPSLQQFVDANGPLDVEHALRIARQIAAGLSAAHRQGLVHRDVKPANVLLEHGVDRVMLTDFGLARAADDASLTHTGAIAGTPHYMSPEQACGDPIDERSDLFSLGSVIYFMLTGRPPFRPDSTLAVLALVREAPVCRLREINPRVPRFVEQIVAGLHAKNKHDRFHTADHLVELLEKGLTHLLQPTTNAPPTIRLRKIDRGWMKPAIVLAITMTISVILLSLALTRTPLSNQQQSNAVRNSDDFGDPGLALPSLGSGKMTHLAPRSAGGQFGLPSQGQSQGSGVTGPNRLSPLAEFDAELLLLKQATSLIERNMSAVSGVAHDQDWIESAYETRQRIERLEQTNPLESFDDVRLAPSSSQAPVRDGSSNQTDDLDQQERSTTFDSTESLTETQHSLSTPVMNEKVSQSASHE